MSSPLRFTSDDEPLGYLSSDDQYNDLSSPLVSHQARRRQTVDPATPETPQATHLPAYLDLASSGPIQSSPIIGTRQEKRAIIRKKAARKQVATLASQRAETAAQDLETWKTNLDDVLDYLKAKDLRFKDLMRYVFNPEYRQGSIRHHNFLASPGAVTEVLDWWISSKSAGVRDEIHSWAVNYVAKRVASEARAITKSGDLRTMGKVIDGDLVSSFNLPTIHDKLCNADGAPVSMKVLESFATSRRIKEHSDKRKERTRMVITSAALACLGEYSHANNLSKRMVGLYLYASGAQRQSISVLSTLGLSESYSNLVSKNIQRKRKNKNKLHDESGEDPDLEITSILRRTGTLYQLSDAMLKDCVDLSATGLFGEIFDNINSAFLSAEQIIGRHDSQENGTCATIFPLFKARLEDIQAKDLQAAFLSAPPLKLGDLLHTSDESQAFKQNLIFTILRIIIKHGGEGFKKFEKDLEKNQPVTDQKIELHKTELHPLPAWKIDESTIAGNIEVDNAVVRTLQLDNFSDRVRFVGGDQLSIARLRAIENIRAGQEEDYAAFSHFALMPGLFHAKIADIHGVLLTHYGNTSSGTPNAGSLAFHNARLDRLPITITSPPAFRVCRDLVFVSLYARVLHCLLRVSKAKSLEDYIADAEVTWKVLVGHAEHIYEQYASSAVVEELKWKQTRSAMDSRDGNPTEGDDMFQNAVLFLRDSLISREFTDAVKAGDSGRVLLVLKTWSLSFRGNGRTKYAYEMLHVIHNLTSVFPKPIRDIVLNNWLLNPSGNPNSSVEMDLVQEHLNFLIKNLYKAHGSNASWEWMGVLAPCVEKLRHLHKNFNGFFGSDQGTRHAPPDLTADIQTLMDSLEDHGVYQVEKGRILGENDKPVIDVIAMGLQHLTDPDGSKNPLSEYNTAFKRLQRRRKMPPVPSQPTTEAPSMKNMSVPAAPSTNFNTAAAGPMQGVSASSTTQNGQADDDMDTLDDGYEQEEEEEAPGELTRLFDDLDNGALEPTLARLTAADVEFDMDDVEVDDIEVSSEDSEPESEDEGGRGSW